MKSLRDRDTENNIIKCHNSSIMQIFEFAQKFTACPVAKFSPNWKTPKSEHAHFFGDAFNIKILSQIAKGHRKSKRCEEER